MSAFTHPLRISHFLLIVCGLVFHAGAASAADLSLGVMDFAKCQRHYYKTSTARSMFSKLRDEKTTQLNEQKDRLKQLMTDQQAASKRQEQGELSAGDLKDAQLRAGEITSLQREVMENQTKGEQELKDEANRIQTELTSEIHQAASRIGKSLGFDLLINVTFGINGVPTAIPCSVPEENDVTDRVIKELNRYAPEGWSPPTSDEE